VAHFSNRNEVSTKIRIALGFLTLGLISGLFFARYQNSDDYLHGTVVPETIFAGKTYENAGVTVAIERIPKEVSFIGHSFLETPTPGAPSNDSDILYEVYSIRGIDPDQAVAIKVLLVGDKTPAAYYFFKYERQSP